MLWHHCLSVCSKYCMFAHCHYCYPPLLWHPLHSPSLMIIMPSLFVIMITVPLLWTLLDHLVIIAPFPIPLFLGETNKKWACTSPLPPPPLPLWVVSLVSLLVWTFHPSLFTLLFFIYSSPFSLPVTTSLDLDCLEINHQHGVNPSLYCNHGVLDLWCSGKTSTKKIHR